MKLEQRFNPAAWAYTCVLTAAIGGNPAFAVEKTAYDGAWSTPDPNISLKITPQAASFTIDGKTYTDTTPEYFNGQLATAPFLYLQADDAIDKQRQHRLYLMVNDAGSISGYYDDANASHPIQLSKANTAPQVSVNFP
ncbi:MAG: hypothetical protein RL122_2714 [Pseudomonadota bacterium]|jgi:hypothetical protein|uniref:Uncharacterized protein n=1 Tax=Thiothrix fructosivorans TaxID=111770 RepID=A0A8B0SEK2_9GAMM|nr:hypothetical protein [Thiothrix fructosivorans]MBO0614650.1 hypothetical protein [Thiothrix fructosivorans]QTX09474.1 hypothetical protein J1836_012650 [Thiothrix fructosivorans]